MGEFNRQVSVIWLMLIALLTSCASHKYSANERVEHLTVKITVDAPDADVFLKNSSVDLRKNLRNGGNSTTGTLVLPSLARKHRIIIVRAPDRVDEEIKLKKTVRGKALAKSASLSVFLYGIPLLVDVFNQDFYKLSKKARTLDVAMNYNREFYVAEWKWVSLSTNPQDYMNYVARYPNSPFVNLANERKEDLFLAQVKLDGSIEALKNYIKRYGNAHNIEEAKALLASELAVSDAYNNALALNKRQPLEDFIDNYPSSKQVESARQELIRVAYEDLIMPLETTQDSVTLFLETYLLPNKSIVDQGFFEEAADKAINRYVSASLEDSETSDNRASKMREWNALTAFQQQFSSDLPELNNLYELNLIKRWTLKYYYNQILNTPRQADMVDQLTEMIGNFPGICSKADGNCLEKVLSANNDKNFELYISDADLVHSFLTEMYERDKLITFRAFKYDGQTRYLWDYADLLRIGYKNNKIITLIAEKNGQVVSDISFTPSEKLIKAAYYIDNTLVGEYRLNERSSLYYYEYRNGQNITLQSDQRILKAKRSYEVGDYDGAISAINDLKATFPINDLNTIGVLQLEKDCYAGIEKEKQLAREAEERRKMFRPRVFTLDGYQFTYTVSLSEISYLSASLTNYTFFPANARINLVHDEGVPGYIAMDGEYYFNKYAIDLIVDYAEKYGYRLITDDVLTDIKNVDVPKRESCPTYYSYYKTKNCPNCDFWTDAQRKVNPCSVCRNSRSVRTGEVGTYTCDKCDGKGYKLTYASIDWEAVFEANYGTVVHYYQPVIKSTFNSSTRHSRSGGINLLYKAIDGPLRYLDYSDKFRYDKGKRMDRLDFVRISFVKKVK